MLAETGRRAVRELATRVSRGFGNAGVRLEGVLLCLACVPSVLVTWSVLRIFASRLTYGTDVELMEGGSLLQAYRVMHGQAVYTTPGVGYMPYPYPPVHTLLLAALGKVFGLRFALGRSVSVAATLLVATLLGREVYLASRRSPFPGVWATLAVGLIAVGFPLTGGEYDIVRLDVLALALTVATGVAAFAVETRASRARLCVTAGLMVLTIFTKQTHAIFVGWIVVFVATRDVKRGVVLGLAVAACSLVILGVLQWVTHGNYWYYTVAQVRRHPVHPSLAWAGLEQLASFAPYVVALPILALLLLRRKALSPPCAPLVRHVRERSAGGALAAREARPLDQQLHSAGHARRAGVFVRARRRLRHRTERAIG